MIVVDDCSTDNSIEIVKKFESIKLVRNKINQGVLQSVFNGIELANGSIITLLDGDDLLAINAIELISEFLSKKTNTAVYTKCRRYNDPNTNIHNNTIKNYEVVRIFKKPLNIMRLNKTGTSAISFYKDNIIPEIHNIPPVLIQDHIIPSMLARHVKRFYFLDALTHIAINWSKNSHITSNIPQMEHDRIEFFWQCIQSERHAGSVLFDFYFRIVLLKKAYKRNKKYRLNVPLGINVILTNLFNLKKLENTKTNVMQAFRNKYNVKYYG